MLKKGQVTIFIIIGIIVLFIIAGLLFVVKGVTKEKIEAEQDAMVEAYDLNSIKIFIDHCLEKTSKNGIKFVSLRGGYYHVPEPAEDQILIKIPYYFDLGYKKVPSEEEIANQIGEYIEENIDECFNNFSAFENSGFVFEKGEMKAQVAFGKNTLFDLNYPLKIKRGEDIKEMNQFSYTLSLNFKKIYSTINNTILEQELNPNFVPIGHLSADAKNNQYQFELNYLDDEVVVFSYIFDQHKIDNENYIFIFANQYNWSELSAKEEINYVQEVEDQRCYVGDICEYDLNIYNDPYLFEDYTELFDISKDGIIFFVPEQEDEGDHSISIRVSDEKSSEKYVYFTYEIKSYLKIPQIKEIPEQIGVVNQSFEYQIELEESIKNIKFSDDSELFEIDSNNTIEFIPTEDAIGLHTIKITANNKDQIDTEWMYLTIKNEE
jgi:hypothetical protein